MIDSAFDLRHRLFYVERRAGHIAGIDHLDGVEGTDLELRVVGPQQTRALPDGGGAEPGARSIARTRIEGPIGSMPQCHVRIPAWQAGIDGLLWRGLSFRFLCFRPVRPAGSFRLIRSLRPVRSV